MTRSNTTKNTTESTTTTQMKKKKPAVAAAARTAAKPLRHQAGAAAAALLWGLDGCVSLFILFSLSSLHVPTKVHFRGGVGWMISFIYLYFGVFPSRSHKGSLPRTASF